MEYTGIDWEALEEKEITQAEYDNLDYSPVYTKIKMNEKDSGRYPE